MSSWRDVLEVYVPRFVEPAERAVLQLVHGVWRANLSPLALTEELERAVPVLLRQGLAPVLAKRVATLREQPAVRDAARAAHAETLLARASLERALHVLRAIDVVPIVLKGATLQRVYASPSLRTFCDADLAVLPRDDARSRVALAEDPGLLRLAARMGPKHSFVDVHDAAKVRRGVGRTIDECFARSVVRNLNGVDVRTLCPEDELRFVARHLIRHSFGRRAIWLTDIGALAEAAGPDFDWGQARSPSSKSAPYAETAVALARDLVGARVPSAALEGATEPTDELREYVVTSLARRPQSRGVREALLRKEYTEALRRWLMKAGVPPISLVFDDSAESPRPRGWRRRLGTLARVQQSVRVAYKGRMSSR